MSKAVVLGSTLLAFAAHVWLLSAQYPWLWWVTACLFAASVVTARISLTVGLVTPLVLAYAAPAVLMLLTGSSDYNLIVLWLALVAGPIFAGSDWRRWHTPARWNIALAAWAAILALTWPVIALREIDFSLIAAGTLNTPNGVYAPSPPLSAAMAALHALGQLLGLLWLDFLWAAFAARRLRDAERIVCLPLLLSVAIACAVGVRQKAVDLAWLSVQPWPWLERAAGLMLDANSFGTAAAIWAPLALALTWRLGWPTIVGALVTTLLAVGMWTSGSRTALLILTIGIVSIAVAFLRGSRRWHARYLPLAFLAAAIVVVLVIAVRSADQSGPLARLMETIPSETEGGLATLGRALWERDGYGLAATRAIADYPWTGVGVGAFPVLAPDYFYLERRLIISGDNAQNWWRHQIAELGLIGALPAIAVSVGVLSMLFVGMPRAPHGAAVTLLRGTVLGVGLASLVGMGTQHPALFLTFVTIVFWLGALLEAPAQPIARRTAWWGVMAMAMLVVAGQIYSASHGLRVAHRAVAHGFTYGYGFSEPQPDPALGLIRHTRSHAVGVIPAEHAYFHVTLIAPHASRDEPVQVKLWRGADLIVDQRVSGPEPIARYVGVPPDAKWLMIEVDVSRIAADGTGLTFSGTWVREIPAGTHPALVVQ